MTLTKEQIDALVAALPAGLSYPSGATQATIADGRFGMAIDRPILARALYLAADLTAEGQRKPERVRCWLYTTCNGKIAGLSTRPETIDPSDTVTPGWFVPDGAE